MERCLSGGPSFYLRPDDIDTLLWTEENSRNRDVLILLWLSAHVKESNHHQRLSSVTSSDEILGACHSFVNLNLGRHRDTKT